MHINEPEITLSLVTKLIAEQFPQWAHLPIKLASSTGSSSVIFRLGDELAVRMPRTQSASLQIEKEERWLPGFAPYLPLTIPVPLEKGSPAQGYPFSWSVYRWLEGKDATVASIDNSLHAATTLGEFIAVLRSLNPNGGPPPGEHNFLRGEPLAERNEETLESMELLRGVIDVDAALAAWKVALEAPVWQGPPLWIHGDLIPSNLLVNEGHLSSVIDWGGMGVGDPACDVMAAWTCLTADAREAFRAAVNVDDATWIRGSGWALSFGVICLPYYVDRNPVLAGIGRHAINEVLSDYKKGFRGVF